MARRKNETIVAPDEEGRSDQDIADESFAASIEEGNADAPSSFSVVDHSKDDDLASRIEVIESPARRGRPPGSSRPRVPKATPSELGQAAPLLVGLTNQVVVTWMGPECGMLQQEANFITPCVARVLTRLPKGAAQQVSLYTDPFIILTALGLWMTRIVKIKDQQAKQKYAVEPMEFARAGGESGTEFQSESVGEVPQPTAQPDDKNGHATVNSILRTVSPT